MTDDRDIPDQFSAPIEADEDGFAGRECPNKDCGGYFKIGFGTGLEGDDGRKSQHRCVCHGLSLDDPAHPKEPTLAKTRRIKKPLIGQAGSAAAFAGSAATGREHNAVSGRSRVESRPSVAAWGASSSNPAFCAVGRVP